MAYQITITLSEDEYQAVAAAAAETGEPIEDLLHEAVTTHFAPRAASQPPVQQISEDEIEEYLYRIGFTSSLPTHEPDTPEEEAEAEKLAELFGQGKPVSEMIIEDRGPY